MYKCSKKRGYNNLIFRTSNELDLREEKLVNEFIKSENPDVIIDCAAKVGGILQMIHIHMNF